jgi:hypothetical protein
MKKKGDPMRLPDPMQPKGGRPRKNVDILQIIGLRWAGHSWREIASQTGLGRGTVHDAYWAAVALLKASENPKNAGAVERAANEKPDRDVQSAIYG